MSLHQYDIRTSMNSFAFNLYRVLTADSTGTTDENVFFAPASVYAALAMTYAGARGVTADELKSALCICEDSRKDSSNFHEVFGKVWSGILKANRSEHCTLNVANRLWIQHDYEIEPGYSQQINTNYRAEAVNVDFRHNPEPTRQIINKWVARETNSAIMQCIAPGALSSDTIIRLINAMYFHGEWQSEFDVQNTKRMIFHSPTGEVDVDMMHQKDLPCGLHKSGHYDCTVLSLAYKNSTLRMVIVLPNQRDGLLPLEARLNNEKFDGDEMWDLHDLRPGKRINLYMPKFQISRNLSLVEPLRSLGIASVFCAASADLGGIVSGVSDLHLSEVSHAAYVTVDEKGTEVVAYTDCSIKRAGGGHPCEVVLDHPFLLQVVDWDTEAIVFMGRVSNPSY